MARGSTSTARGSTTALGRMAPWCAAVLLAACGPVRAADPKDSGDAPPSPPAAGSGQAASQAATARPSVPRGAPVAVGSSSGALAVDGVRRTYRVYRPAAIDSGAPVPLVVMLHGGFGSGAQAEQWYGWDAMADRHRFVVVYPDGLNRAWNVGGGCCGSPGHDGVADVEYVTRLVADLRARLPLDDRRIYATGISNGGMLAYRLACDTTLFAAVAPVAATLLGTCPAPAPVSVLHLHGTADPTVRYDGGRGSGIARIDGPPVPELIARWRRVDGCRTPTTTVSGPVTTSDADCPRGREVRLMTVDGAGHQWPGSVSRPAVERVLGMAPPSAALDATSVIWQFLERHPRPEVTARTGPTSPTG